MCIISWQLQSFGRTRNEASQDVLTWKQEKSCSSYKEQPQCFVRL